MHVLRARPDLTDLAPLLRTATGDAATGRRGGVTSGLLEERLKAVLYEVQEANGEIVLFIDEIHTVVGAGKADGAMDAGNLLKPALARGQLRCIGATTLDEYRQYIEKDAALERRFQKVLILQPYVTGPATLCDGHCNPMAPSLQPYVSYLVSPRCSSSSRASRRRWPPCAASPQPQP